MGASIYYQPFKGKYLPIGAPSSFLAAMERAIQGAPPWVLSAEDSILLRGLAAGLESADQREAIEELLEAIDRHGVVRVWAVY